MRKQVLFLTGTRADFGKLKPLMCSLENHPRFNSTIFVTGMHTMARYGSTVDEVKKSGFANIYQFINQIHEEPMDMVLANTIHGLSRYVHENRPDLIVVHGDRVETLAGAIVGALNNILTAHIEGGELSGTVDELLRHSVSKLAHLHFVSNDEAAERLCRMGENPESIFIIGSPDLDILFSDSLPELEDVLQHYEIPFVEFAIAIYHPVTTELHRQSNYAKEFVSALIESNKQFIIIYPNNDKGCNDIFYAYKRLETNPNFKLIPSVRFESFLTLMKSCDFIIGNSSSGVREMPAIGGRTINVGSRQDNRHNHDTIVNAFSQRESILSAINQVTKETISNPSYHFGRGESTQKFIKTLESPRVWEVPRQKQFRDLLP